MEMKTTNEINEYFSEEIDNYKKEDDTLDNKNKLFSQVVNKKWVSVESLKEFLKNNGRVIDLNHSEKDMIYTSELLEELK